jgi:hypothetical protein
MRVRLILATLIGGLLLAGSAGGFIAGRIFTVRPGDRADFNNVRQSAWQCFNHGSAVTCRGGDAFPYVDLTSTNPGGVTVIVHTLRDPQGGHLTRRYRSGYPVYVFTAF